MGPLGLRALGGGGDLGGAADIERDVKASLRSSTGPAGGGRADGKVRLEEGDDSMASCARRRLMRLNVKLT